MNRWRLPQGGPGRENRRCWSLQAPLRSHLGLVGGGAGLLSRMSALRAMPVTCSPEDSVTSSYLGPTWILPEGIFSLSLSGCPWPIARPGVPHGGCTPGAKADYSVTFVTHLGTALSSLHKHFNLLFHLIFTRTM